MNSIEKLTTIYNCTWNLPLNQEEIFVRGNFISDSGEDTYFEVPAIFNEDGTCDETASLDKVVEFIGHLNRAINTNVLNGVV